MNKGMGLAATIVGALFGGTLMVKLGLYRALADLESDPRLADVYRHEGRLIAQILAENLRQGDEIAHHPARIRSCPIRAPAPR